MGYPSYTAAHDARSPYTETEVMVAVLEEDDEKLTELLNSMTAAERTKLVRASLKIARVTQERQLSGVGARR